MPEKKRDRTQSFPLPPPRLSYRISEASVLTGIGQSRLLELIHEGRLDAVQFGHGRERAHFIIPHDSIVRFLNGCRSGELQEGRRP